MIPPEADIEAQTSKAARLLALKARREILIMTSRAGASHVASALSVVDILATLYSGVAKIEPQNMSEPDRDVIILSKGHSASALYSILALCGFFPMSWLAEFCQNDALLGGHITSSGVQGVELSTGSLGHGLPYGLGIALSRKLSHQGGKVFVIMSDGECDEGTTWESALLANHHELSNLCVIIDRNRIQSMSLTEETLKLEPFEKKWAAFGWDTETINGHSYEELHKSINRIAVGPKCIIAETTKGKGIPFMENSVLWHYRPPSKEDLATALSLLEEGKV